MVNLAPAMSSHSSPNSSKAAGLAAILVHVARINVPSVWQVFPRTRPPPCWHPSVISLHCSGVLAADGRGPITMTPKAKPSIATSDISRFIVLRVPDSIFFIFSPLKSLGRYCFQMLHRLFATRLGQTPSGFYFPLGFGHRRHKQSSVAMIATTQTDFHLCDIFATSFLSSFLIDFDYYFGWRFKTSALTSFLYRACEDTFECDGIGGRT
jgi:hypothetical protein